VGIKLLAPEIAAKIAAGEVIIRPSSVVKELVENSLDAGAKRIEVYLERGGKALIRITDDGAGIAADEVELAVQRFATSKLLEAGDLERIASYGFRGEALASAAEVSELQIETQQKDSESGVRLRIKAGRITERKEIVRTPGTTITVRNLFFNLPARRAFLKSDPYERRLALDVVRTYALLNHTVSLTAGNQKGTLLGFQAAVEWIDRIYAVYPDLRAVEMIFLKEGHRLLDVEGVIVRPDQASQLRRMQRTFFNGRPVLYRSIFRAVIEGFGPQPGNRPPFFILKLQAPPEMLDANIHPAKTEVRYRDERFLFDFISQAVQKAVRKEAVDNLDSLRQDPQFPANQESSLPFPSSPPPSLLSSPSATTLHSSGHENTQDTLSSASAESIPQRSHLGFWQLQGLYVLAQTSSGLIIVDQHAAHERILYEEMLEQLGSIPRQRLLFPLIVDLTPEEFATFEEIANDLMELGFEAKPFGPNQVIIETFPADSKMGHLELRDLFREFNETNEVKLGNRDKMAALIACKAAIKAGTTLSQAEMESLINRLFQCKAPFFCPHGRPTAIKFSMDDLAKRFGRI
jgi:DNA mismatch repair protein MutL